MKSMQTMLQKTFDEAESNPSEAIAKSNFPNASLTMPQKQVEPPPQVPSQADSLHKQLADVSQQSFKKSSEECLPSPSPSVEATEAPRPSDPTRAERQAVA